MNIPKLTNGKLPNAKRIPMDLVVMHGDDLVIDVNDEQPLLFCPTHTHVGGGKGKYGDPDYNQDTLFTTCQPRTCPDAQEGARLARSKRYTQLSAPWHFKCTYKPQALDDFSPLTGQWIMQLRQLLYYDNGMHRYLDVEIVDCLEIRCYSRLFCNGTADPSAIHSATEITREDFNKKFKPTNTVKQYLEYFTNEDLSAGDYSQLLEWLYSRHIISEVSLITAQELITPWKEATDKIVFMDWAEAVNLEYVNAISPNARKYLGKINKFGPLHKKPPLIHKSDYPMPLSASYSGGKLVPDFEAPTPSFGTLEKKWTPVGHFLKTMAFIKNSKDRIHHLFLSFDCRSEVLYVDTITDHTWTYQQITPDFRLSLILHLLETGYIRELDSSINLVSFLKDYREACFQADPTRLSVYSSDINALIRPTNSPLNNMTIKRW